MSTIDIIELTIAAVLITAGIILSIAIVVYPDRVLLYEPAFLISLWAAYILIKRVRERGKK